MMATALRHASKLWMQGEAQHRPYLRCRDPCACRWPWGHAIMYKEADAMLEHPQHLGALDHAMQWEAVICT